MVWFSRICFGVVALSMLMASYAHAQIGKIKRPGFVISLVETGEVVLSDEHIASYELESHCIFLSKVGVDHWASFGNALRGTHRLAKEKFLITVDGTEMYQGYFWSSLSSQMMSGVIIYVEAILDRLCVVYHNFDPRAQPLIQSHFRRLGSLKEPE